VGNDVKRILSDQPDGFPRLTILAGYVSLQKPAPAGFDDSLWAIIPSHGESVAIPLSFPAIHGATLPMQGTQVVIGIDNNRTPHVLTWYGPHT